MEDVDDKLPKPPGNGKSIKQGIRKVSEDIKTPPSTFVGYSNIAACVPLKNGSVIKTSVLKAIVLC